MTSNRKHVDDEIKGSWRRAITLEHRPSKLSVNGHIGSNPAESASKRKKIVVGVIIALVLVAVLIALLVVLLPKGKGDGAVGAPPDLSEYCITSFNGICYWVEVRRKQEVDYFKAVDICKQMSMQIAVIPNADIMLLISNKIRPREPSYRKWTSVWMGVTIDPMTGILTPRDAYGSFFYFGLLNAPYQKNWNKVYLYVEKRHVFDYVNADATHLTYGVVCSFPEP
ncbi:uncharacterized protein LOC120328847 [Styela clava]